MEGKFLNRRRITGFVFLALSLFYLYNATLIPASQIRNDPGPRIWPYMAGGLMLICSLVLIFVMPEAEKNDHSVFLDTVQKKRFVIMYAALAVYIVLMEFIGYTIPTFLMMSYMCWAFSRGKKTETSVRGCILYGLLSTVLVYVFFTKLLNIALPLGRVPALNLLTYL